MKHLLATFLFVLLAAGGAAGGGPVLDFSLHRQSGEQPGSTLLVIGGIQGDEPGGFNAASLLATHYRIRKGSVWVVPNLNFISIIRRQRGVYGDLNRKFDAIPADDPEFSAIVKIKSILLDPRVDLILNLHDGSGFYRPVHQDDLHNPARWGQSLIVDQRRMENGPFRDLAAIAEAISAGVNRHLLEPAHAFHVKNTRTREGNREMAKTLTYFAVRQGKPAFGLEASKSFPTHERAYYHLHALEGFMQVMGIAYERHLRLTAAGVREAIDQNLEVAFYGDRIFLDVNNARSRLNYIPLKKGAAVEFVPGNPLLTVVERGPVFEIYHGNRSITRLHPQFFDYDPGVEAVTLEVDGKPRATPFGTLVKVRETFSVVPREGCRVNVIGFTDGDRSDEAGLPISLDRMLRRFSIDRDGWIYRVEVYRRERFGGMVLVDFGPECGDPRPRRFRAGSGARVARLIEDARTAGGKPPPVGGR